MDISSIFCLRSVSSFYFCLSFSSYSALVFFRVYLLRSKWQESYLSMLLYLVIIFVFPKPSSWALPQLPRIVQSFCCWVKYTLRYLEKLLLLLFEFLIKLNYSFLHIALFSLRSVASLLLPNNLILKSLYLIGQELHLFSIVFCARIYVHKDLPAFFLGPISPQSDKVTNISH